MGKAKRGDLGDVQQDRINTELHSKSNNPGKHFQAESRTPPMPATFGLTLASLSGVNLPATPTTDDVLTWDGTQWRSATAAASGGGISYPITPSVDVRGTVTTSTITFNLASPDAHHHTLTLATDVTITFTNPPTQDVAIQMEIDVTQNGTGNFDLFFSNDLLTAAPSIKKAADARTVLVAQTQHPTTTAAYSIFDTALKSGNVAGDNLGNHTMTEDLKAGGFDIENLAEIRDVNNIYFEPTGIASDTAMHIYGDTASNLVSHIATGNAFLWVIAGSTVGQFDDDNFQIRNNNTGMIFNIMNRKAGIIDLAQIGEVRWQAPNDAVATPETYARILVNADDVSSGSIDGRMSLIVAEADTLTTYLELNQFSAPGTIQVLKPLDVNQNPVQFDQEGDSDIATPAAGQRVLYFSTDEAAMVAKDSSGVIHNLEAAAAGDNLGDHTATQDLDMATFDITGVGGVFFRAGGGNDAEIDSTGAGLQIKIASDQTIKFIEDTTLGMEFNRSGNMDLWMASHDIRQFLTLVALNGGSITDVSGNWHYNAPTTNVHQFQVASNSKVDIGTNTMTVAVDIDMDGKDLVLSEDKQSYIHSNATDQIQFITNAGQIALMKDTTMEVSGDLEMNGNDITGLDDIFFSTTFQQIVAGATGLNIQVPSDDTISLMNEGNDIIDVQKELILCAKVLRLASFSDASRPTAANAGAGGCIWSTTDGAPIYSDGTNWRLFSDDSAT